eukprot:TRINITY_DN2930_c0_g1_i1.p1 TRINITY_DN2930_c0_g1~~TRINITY_DN2930_c0_g1_i1.p1  ORF type:complete len:165 (+),score=56.33 TRINITY_DN2930_c0_g1_i1:65-559(+)
MCIRDSFYTAENMGYNEAKFLSYITKTWRIDTSSFSKYELERYNEGIKLINQFSEMDEAMSNYYLFLWEVKGLYLEWCREINTPNFWTRRESTTHTFEEDLNGCLTKFNNLVRDLNGNPLWQEKVKDECGYYIHLLYNSMSSNDTFLKIFDKYDKQYYFKQKNR